MPFTPRDRPAKPNAGPHKPPLSKPRPGYAWVWRNGCNCVSCPWQPHCVGQHAGHWTQVIVEFPRRDVTVPGYEEMLDAVRNAMAMKDST